MQLPLKGYDPGFINCVVHSLTGSQILYHLFSIWSENPNESVILWCRKGDAEWKVNAVRVALSKERKARGVPRTFELRFSEVPWPYTFMGIKGEAVKVERVNGSIQTRMRAAMFKKGML
jgi:hypothetical protein